MEFFNLSRITVEAIINSYNIFAEKAECYYELVEEGRESIKEYHNKANTIDERYNFLTATAAGNNQNEIENLMINDIKKEAARFREWEEEEKENYVSDTRWARTHKALSFIVPLATLCLLPFAIALDLVMLPFKALYTLASGVSSLFNKSDNSYQETPNTDQLQEKYESVTSDLDVAEEPLVTLQEEPSPVQENSTAITLYQKPLVWNSPVNNVSLLSMLKAENSLWRKFDECAPRPPYARCKL